jgi:hypothetical protein
MPYVVGGKSTEPVGDASFERETTERYVFWEETCELRRIVVGVIGGDWGDKKEDYGENANEDHALTPVHVRSPEGWSYLFLLAFRAICQALAVPIDPLIPKESGARIFLEDEGRAEASGNSG